MSNKAEGSSAAPTSTKIGDTVKLGDWEVTVTKVRLDADKAIKNANQFNAKPDGTYLPVDYIAKYTGDERRRDTRFDLKWKFTDTSNTVLNEASVVTPAGKLDTPTEARNGGSVKGQSAFDVPTGKAKGGMLGVSTMFGDAYADFTV